ncbi:hypothetical protein AB0942_05065 [Streptomyces nodosus]|uniref:hypothetical protein n=1 Tax=Streptomyces nodosus TaxID=40318 RepID=UPI003451391D
MAHAVLALGVSVVTASGSVWYLPAVADLRAGADRPLSRRSSATACLTGWATAAVVAVLLLVADSWWPAVVLAVTGAFLTAAFRTRARAQRGNEQREAARHWASLTEDTPGTAGAGGRFPYAVAVILGAGLAVALATATLLLAAGSEDGPHRWTVAVVPAAVVAGFLTLAFTRTSTARRRAAGHLRTPR